MLLINQFQSQNLQSNNKISVRQDSAIMTSTHTHYHNDTYSKERQHSSSSSQNHASQKSNSQSSRYNGSNKFCEEYSFNRQGSFSRDSEQMQVRQRHVYRPNNLQEGDSMTNRNPELLKKYSTIYNQLQVIESLEVIHLFLEEIQQNERCRTKIFESEMRIRGLQQENIELKSLLQRKREAIRKLCQTQSNNLNIIECLQHQSDKTFNWDSHFLVKYQELEAYMNQYIASTNEAQEEFTKSFKILKQETQRITQQNQKLQKQNFEYQRQLQMVKLRQMKCIQSLGIFKEKQKNLMIQFQNLHQENISLRKTVQQLSQNIKANQQFEVQLTKENRELSSELDFIREKINQNQSLSRDIFEKIESHSELAQRLNKEKQELEHQMEKIASQNDCLLKSKQDAESKLQALLKQFNEAITNNQRLIFDIEEKDKIIQELRMQIQQIKHEEQELLQEFQNEKQSKHLIKSQLIDLAEQVKFMESTYKKEIIQNEKIKIELQKFWQRSSTDPLKEVFMNGSQAQSMKTSKASYSKNSRASYQHETLF